MNYDSLIAPSPSCQKGLSPNEPEVTDLPENRNDYPGLDTTAAHWRPGELDQQDGSVIETGGTIPEVTAEQDFSRQEGINGAEEAGVTFTNTSHRLSSDGAAVCFANVGKHFGGSDVSRLNYFTTDDDTAINRETFENGYTAEPVDESSRSNRST